MVNDGGALLWYLFTSTRMSDIASWMNNMSAFLRKTGVKKRLQLGNIVRTCEDL